MKTCRLCGETKPLEDFHAAPGTVDGHRGECISCFRGLANARNRKNPQPNRDRAQRWQRSNPERVKATRDRAIADGRKKLADRKSHLKRKYGMTLEQYEDMLEAQRGRCAICGRKPTEGISLHVDHDHETGEIRALLCFRCNNAIGDLGEQFEKAEKLAAYLFEHDPQMSELRDLARQRVAALRR